MALQCFSIKEKYRESFHRKTAGKAFQEDERYRLREMNAYINDSILHTSNNLHDY